ncbi:MAG: RHS repeat-associated core domain-containing protein [Arenicella sp.]
MKIKQHTHQATQSMLMTNTQVRYMKHLMGKTMRLIGLMALTVITASTAYESKTVYETNNYTKATHEEMVEDMRVKVLGGYISVNRYYRVVKQRAADADGNILYVGVSGATRGFTGNSLRGRAGSGFRSSTGRSGGSGGSSSGSASAQSINEPTASLGVWQFHRQWHDLVFLDRDLATYDFVASSSINGNSGSGGGASVNSITSGAPKASIASGGAKYIDRNDFVYVKKPGSDYFEYQHNGADLRITETDTGYRWSNRKGDWVDYDNEGKAIRSGDKNNVTINLVRNAEGYIAQYKDHLGRVVLTYSYQGNKPVRVEDYTGRRVSYGWDGNYLKTVTTTRGHDWQYDYELVGNNTVLTQKTDPENQTFRYNYQMSGGGYVAIANSNGSITTIGDANATAAFSARSSGGGSGGGSASASVSNVAVQSMLLHTEKVYPDGKRQRYQYFYDPDSKTYTLIETDSDGFERERQFDLDGQTKLQFKGGLLAGKRIRSNRTAVSTDAYGNKTTTKYTRFEAIESRTLPDGSTVRYEYLPQFNFPTVEVDEIGVQTQHEYDAKGNRIKTVEGFGSDDERIMEYVYDQYGQVTLERYLGRTNPDGSTADTVEMRYEYDASGNLTKYTDGNGNVMQYQNHNAMGQYQTMIDGRGKTWQYTYDNHGNKLTETSPLGFVTRFEYDSIHRLTKVTDAEGRITTNAYDSRNNLITTIDNAGNVRSMSYRMDGLILSDKDESNQVTSYRYDRAARLIEVTDGVGNQTHMTYEKGDELAGRRIESVVTPNNKIIYEYDKRNRAVTQSVQSAEGKNDNLFSTTQTTYTKRSERQAVTDANGNITRYEYNVHGELQNSTNAENETVRYDYDNRGNLIKVTDGLGHSTYYGFDQNNNKVTETRPAQTVGPIIERQTYGYDQDNNLVQTIDYKGNVAIYTLDDDGRVITQSNTPASAPVKDGSQADRVINYRYDNTDLPTSYADQFTSASYQYDSLGRLIEQTTQFQTLDATGNSTGATQTSVSKTLKTSYHANSQVKAKTDAEDNLTSYSYDGAGKLSQIAIQNAGSILVNDYEGNLPARITYPGGTTRQHEYDGLARLARILVNDNANNPKMDYGYQFDPVGNITEKTTKLGAQATSSFTYSYDRVYRLTNAQQPNQFGDQRYSYDQNSNRLTRDTTIGNEETSFVYGYNDQQELTSIQTTLNAVITNNTLEYDANGAVTSNTDTSTTPNSAENLGFTYNSYGRVQSIEKGDAATAATLGDYQYDPQGRRISKTVNGETTYFLYDDTGVGLAGEYTQEGELIRSYGYQPNGLFTTDPVYLKTPKASTGAITTYEFSYYQNDHLGTPQQLVQISGATVWQGEYDVFGMISETNTQVEQPLRFAGQYHDKETDLYYNWNRFYSPQLGRYITSDPIGMDGGFNRFGYVSSDPLNSFDDDGLRRKLFREIGKAINKQCKKNKTCREQKCRALNYYMHEICDRGKTTCKGNDSCHNLRWKKHQHQFCISLRKMVKACYNKLGRKKDPNKDGHEKAIRDKRDAIRNCDKKLKRNNCCQK